MIPSIAISSGEPAGIGPDICATVAMLPFDARIVFVADPSLIETRARLLGLDLTLREIDDDQNIAEHQQGIMQILPITAAHPSDPGELNLGNSPYVLKTIDTAVDLCNTKKCDAMVTAPVQKSAINQAGIRFTGHTERIAEKTGSNHPVMMLTNSQFRVCLATTHMPLARVPENITQENLCRTAEIIHSDMQKLFGIKQPRIAVCGLNPHAGESGHLGTEEQETIKPAIAKMQNAGIAVTGPIPADTAFTSRSLGACDVVLAMYHDQGLPVIKHSGFGKIVNITLGLPIVRTSVDHGTALDLAGTGNADHSSLRAAINMAIALSKQSAERR